MRSLTFIFVLAGAMASAQNWALLNPAYKYNYANDGSDTISNQIFVTHIDTLGVDSFRYELNRIGVVCDTCPASMCDACGSQGWPEACDGCFVRTNQPQFLGYDCIRAGEDWHFNGLDTFLVKSSAGIGASWVFNSSTGTIATVEAEWPAELFGAQDTLRRVLVGDDDTLLLSRSFGILYFSSASMTHELIGVEGAEVGVVYPDPLAFFDYQPGDVLTYHARRLYLCSWEGGPPNPETASHYWTTTITGRETTGDTLTYTTSVAQAFGATPPGLACTLYSSPNWPVPFGQWIFTPSTVLSNHPILGSYPGQVMDTSICWISILDWTLPKYLTTYTLSPEGRAIVRSQHLGDAQGSQTSYFDGYQEPSPGIYPFSDERLVNVWYEEGLGVRKAEFMVLQSFGLSVELVGAVIGGDTIIQPPAIHWTVGMPEAKSSSLLVSPNPASEAMYLKGVEQGILRILDLEGRILRTMRISAKDETVDVRDLAAGTYLLSLMTAKGQVSTRFSVLH